MNRKDALLTLAKALQDISARIDGLEFEELEKAEEGSDEHKKHMEHPAYRHFYLGARSVGASHREAHKGAKSNMKKAKDHGKPGHGHGSYEYWTEVKGKDRMKTDEREGGEAYHARKAGKAPKSDHEEGDELGKTFNEKPKIPKFPGTIDEKQTGPVTEKPAGVWDEKQKGPVTEKPTKPRHKTWEERENDAKPENWEKRRRQEAAWGKKSNDGTPWHHEIKP